MIKMFATDLDGTLLLGKQPGCDEFISSSLKDIMEKGYYVSVATGRNLHEIQMEPSLWDLHTYIVSMNGAIIMDCQRNVIKSYPFSSDMMKEIAEEFKDYPFEYLGAYKKWVRQDSGSFEAYLLDNVPEKFKQVENYKEVARSFFKHDIYEASLKDLTSNEIYKIDFLCSDDHVESALRQRLENMFGKDVFHIAYDGMSIEITRKEADKGSALSYLSTLLNLKKEEVAVFGDSGNDITMLKMFPHSYAVENAVEAAKRSASYCIGKNTEYAVINTMKSLIK